MNPFFIPVYHLYLLQLENYELTRYFQLIFAKGYLGPGAPLRKTIVWTPKARSIFFLSFVLFAVGAVTVYLNSSITLTVLFVVIGFFCFPILYSVVLCILSPIDSLVKYIVITKARRVLQSSKNVKVIAIAGSYGKTTMKDILLSVLSAKFYVIATPESVNTPVGIAQWLTKTITDTTEIIIVEMGEHYKGDIAYICSITPPDVAVLTGINEAHLERLKNLETSIKTMFEVVNHAKSHARIILNSDDEYIKKSYKGHVHKKHVSFYSQRIQKKEFNERKLSWIGTFENIGSIEIPLLGEYAVGDVDASIVIGASMGMNAGEIKKGIAAIKPVTHRLEPISGAGGSLVIDDSYNGNPDGVYEAIHVLSRFKKRRKIFITPGLVEIGNKSPEIHEAIGRELARVADRVILIKNSVTPYIEKGLREGKFDETHIIWFNTAGEAHEALSGIIQEKDVILFQNDWGDQYV